MRRAHDATAAATVEMTADAEVAHGFSEAEFRRFYEQTARPLRAWLRRVAAFELFDDFAQDTRERVRQLVADAGEATLLRRHAHALKGGALSFGARGLGECAAKIEAAAAADDLAAARRLLDGLAGLAERSLLGLGASLDQLAGAT